MKKITDNETLKAKIAQSQAQQRQRRPPRNFASRREQIRLFVLCGMLMLVLIMMNEARKPSTWDFLWAGEQETVEPEDPIDTRIDLDEQPVLPVDGFIAEKPQTDPSPTDSNAELVPEVTPELLAPIKDNTVLRAAENDAWLAMLGALQSRTSEEVDSLSIGNVGFAQLFRQTDFYRGQVVTVSGTVRRLEAITPRENEHGIDQLYRWILQPRGSSSAPIVIYSIEKPAQLDIDDDLREPCSFTGFCFKRWAYVAGDGTRVAPLLLAKTPAWQPPTPPAPVELPSVESIVISLLSLAALAAVISTMVHRSANVKRADIDRLRMLENDLGELENENVLPGPADALRAMAETSDEAAKS